MLTDDEGQWVSRVREIIGQHLTPLRLGSRPVRPRAVELLEDEEGSAKDEEDGAEDGEDNAAPSATTKTAGKAEYQEVVRNRHNLLFYSIMEQCARR